MIQYKDGHLIIDIRTSSPEETHSLLMSALASSMRILANGMENYTNEDPDNIAFLASFLRDIIPDGRQLACMNN